VPHDHPPHDPPHRAAASLAGAQLGDTHIEATGGDHIHQGLSGADVAALLVQQQEFSLTFVSALERTHQDTARKIDNIRADMDLRFAQDNIQRRRRQRTLNLALVALVVTQALLLVGMLLLLWQLWPVIIGTAARVLVGAGVALAAAALDSAGRPCRPPLTS